MHFEFSFVGLFISLFVLASLLLIRLRFKNRAKKPILYYSNVKSFEPIKKGLKERLIKVPQHLKLISFVLLLLALCAPVLLLPQRENRENNNASNPDQEERSQDQVHMPTEGIAIYFVLDQSGSMEEEMGYIKGFSTQSKRATRIDVLKYLTQQFIKGNKDLGLSGRQDDLVGLVSFARVPQVLMPLTLEREPIYQSLNKLRAVREDHLQGTAIGYAIYKTAHTIAATEHFAKQIKGEDKPAYDIKNTIMILVTDGFQFPNLLDRGHPLRNMGVIEASNFASEKGIKLYIVDVEPALNHPQFKDQRLELQNAAENTGGQFFVVSDVDQLKSIYQTIDQIEKSEKFDPKAQKMIVEDKVVKEKSNPNYTRYRLYVFLSFLALLLLLTSSILETTYLRKLP